MSRSKTEKLDELSEQVARLTSSHPDDKAKARITRNTNSLKLLDEAWRRGYAQNYHFVRPG